MRLYLTFWILAALFGPWLLAAEWKQGAGYRYRPLNVTGEADGFSLIAGARTGVNFTNTLSIETAADNEILLNGSGVALGDVDGDGLVDIYLSRLQGANALYRNKGGFQFEDITSSAGVGCTNQFSTSAVLADLDGDQDLDLLVGGVGSGLRIFQNDGKGRFQEITQRAKVNSSLTSSSIALADIDGDGDLDIYHCTYRGSTIRNREIKFRTLNGRRVIDAPKPEDYEFTRQGTLLEHAEPDQIFINNGKGQFELLSWTGGKFKDEDGNPLKEAHRDWGLSVQFRDMTQDGAPDIYVCNDFFSPDRIWINDGKGNFRLISKFAVRHTSSFSMGVDFADINRDGHDDFFVTDMLSRSHFRRMTQSVMAGPGLPDPNDRPQAGHNTLFLNRGDNTYAEIAQLAKLHASDWSWSTVFMDVDLDGFEDLLVTTGHYYDSQDADAENKIAGLEKKPTAVERLKLFPRLNIPNYAFHNNRDLTFEEKGVSWGFNLEGISHGLATADLDGDGDLDLVVNNLNAPASIYRNNSAKPRIAIRTSKVGTRLTLSGKGISQSQEVISGGRYLSGCEQIRVFAGMGNKLEVQWRNGKRSVISVQTNHVYELEDLEEIEPAKKKPTEPMFKEFAIELASDEQLPFVDWDRQPSLPRALSRRSPRLLVDDLDKNGWPDLLYGTGRGELYVYTNYQGALSHAVTVSAPNGLRDVLGITRLGSFVSVIYSSYETTGQGGALMNYFYETNSLRRVSAIPLTNSEPGALASADVDGNGDYDLFLGHFSFPGKYPMGANSVLFMNRAGSYFYNTNLPKGIGLVTSAAFADIDGDTDSDLLVSSELGPIRTFKNEAGKFTEITTNLGLHQFFGFWGSLSTGDFNGDGKLDIVAGNIGRNIPYEGEITYHYGDWADNGSVGIFEARENLPLTGADMLAKVLPGLGDKFGSYSNYGRAKVIEVLKGINYLTARADTFESSIFIQTEKGFERKSLPIEAQFSPANSISTGDFNKDGKLDLFVAQNQFGWREDYSRTDAGRGLILLGDGKGGFKAHLLSGIAIYGEQRDSAAVDLNQDGKLDLIVAEIGNPPRVYLNQH